MGGSPKAIPTLFLVTAWPLRCKGGGQRVGEGEVVQSAGSRVCVWGGGDRSSNQLN